MNQLQEKANYFRVCQILIEKGGDAFRRVLQTKISSSPSPSTLKSLLCAYKKSLQKLRYSVINATQWKLLFPSSGSPDSNNFDITLLTILLRNICGLPSPVTGCSAMPPACDTSASAEILRIKMFRNEVYGHISIAQLDNIKFETLWQQISQTLINLGIPQQDIDKLKQTALSPEEESYIKKLKEWKELEDNLSSKLDDIEQEVVKLREEIVRSRKIEENVKTAEVNKLAKFVFEGKIKGLSKKFQIGTRKWFFYEFKEWLDDKKSAVMILTAGPGVGKSVLSARICELYKESGQLAACHFCDFRTSDSRDPCRILESLASQMCDNVDGFRDKLTEVLSRKHSRDSLSDTFRVLLNDPLHALHRTEQMLIVVDALDESKAAVKSELSDLISDEFFQLPKWIKIFISSRPELQVREKLGHLNPVEIRPDDDKHNLDLKQFIQYHIPNISNSTLQSLVSKCEGSFLYAYHLVKEIPVKQVESEVIPNVNVDIPKGISGFYKKQFKCLKKDFTVSKCKVKTEEKRMETDPLVADVETKFYGLEDKGFGSWSPEIFSLHSNEMDFPMDEPKKHMSMFQAFYNFTNTAVQRYIHNMTSIITKSQDVDERKIISELLDSTSKIQAALGETIHSLDLFESYLKHPNERTAVSLKHSFDHGKCSDTPLKAKEINGFLEALRSLLISNSVNDKECKETAEDCCQDSYNSETKTLDLDFNSQSHHESTKKNFENRGWTGNGKLKNVAVAYDHNNPGNVIEKGKDYLAWKVQELEDENLSLKKQLESRKLQNRELLIELGQVTVEKTAKENEEKRYEHFRLIYHAREGERPGTSNIRNKRSNINMSATQNAYKNGYQQSSDASGSTKPQIAHGIYDPLIPITSNANTASSRSRESLVNGAEALVQQNNHEQNKDENDENESGLEGSENERNRVSAVKTSRDEQTATTQNTPSVQPEETGAHDQASTSRNDNSDLSFSVQQDDSGRESVSLSNIPPASVATTLYNNYKFLLLLLAQKLLSSDVTRLKDWAAQNFSISNPQNATDILLQLDQKGVINASDLRQLSDFLESILRFDLVYIIDAFLLGDYSLLRQSQASKNHAVNLVQNHGNRALFRNPGFSNAISTRQFSTSMSKSLTISRKPVNNSEVQNSLPQSQPQASRNFSTQQYPNKPAAGCNSIRMVEVAAGEGPVTNEKRTTSGTAGTRTTSLPASETGKSSTVSSNGSKLSKFQRPDNERSNSLHWDPGLDSNWLCSHYKRHCYVKFDCCDKFWPCHRCHNNQSTCGRKKLKSRDTRMLKCAYCNKVQQFGEYCCDCGAKFASYYCGLCKHLTGTDDHPYHCEKCGICRIHGDRSFHCDVCGVCLDVQLRGNHKCRAGSAHDECCICLEDAFTGCQILPCSHKVHKECATQMIRSGITRCPICRESFAHKLERQPQNSRKRPGKF